MFVFSCWPGLENRRLPAGRDERLCAGKPGTSMRVKPGQRLDLECGDKSPLSDWETCLPVPKRGRVRALHIRTLPKLGRFVEFSRTTPSPGFATLSHPMNQGIYFAGWFPGAGPGRAGQQRAKPGLVD
jgi:hypothetical protein